MEINLRKSLPSSISNLTEIGIILDALTLELSILKSEIDNANSNLALSTSESRLEL